MEICRSFCRIMWAQIQCEPIHYPQHSNGHSRRYWNTSCHTRLCSLSHGSMPTTLACPDNISSQIARLQSALLVETKCGTERIGRNAGHVSVPLVIRVICSLYLSSLIRSPITLQAYSLCSLIYNSQCGHFMSSKTSWQLISLFVL